MTKHDQSMVVEHPTVLGFCFRDVQQEYSSYPCATNIEFTILHLDSLKFSCAVYIHFLFPVLSLYLVFLFIIYSYAILRLSHDLLCPFIVGPCGTWPFQGELPSPTLVRAADSAHLQSLNFGGHCTATARQLADCSAKFAEFVSLSVCYCIFCSLVSLTLGSDA